MFSLLNYRLSEMLWSQRPTQQPGRRRSASILDTFTISIQLNK